MKAEYSASNYRNLLKQKEEFNSHRNDPVKEQVKEQVNNEGSEKSSEKILELIKNDPNISAAAIAEKIGVSSRAVEKQLKKLREENLIRRVGPDKGGHWEIVEK